MKYGPKLHHRRSIRLSTYDYSEPGAYFVTICTHRKECILDTPTIRRAVELAWRSIGRYCQPARSADFVVMPNHVHGIIWLTRPTPVGAQHTPKTRRHSVTEPGLLTKGHPDESRAAPLRGLRGLAVARHVESSSLAAIVRAFKSNTTKRINALRNTPNAAVWQRNYYEHVIRSEADLLRVREYIRDNPAKWHEDPDNPANVNRKGTRVPARAP